MKHKDNMKIEDREVFIEQFKDFSPAENNEEDIKKRELIEKYKLYLDGLKLVKEKIIGILNSESASDPKYPKEIRRHHITVASVIALCTLLSVAGLICFSLGGSNMSSWPTYLPIIGIAAGIPMGLLLATPIYLINKNTFDVKKATSRIHTNKLLNLLDLERTISLKADEKALAVNNLLSENNINKILSGNYSIYDQKQVLKTINKEERVVDVAVTKDEFKVLSKKSNKKLEELLKTYNERSNILNKMGAVLNSTLKPEENHATNNVKKESITFEFEDTNNKSTTSKKKSNLIFESDYYNNSDISPTDKVIFIFPEENEPSPSTKNDNQSESSTNGTNSKDTSNRVSKK